MEIILLEKNNAHLLNNLAEEVFDHKINPNSLQSFLECPRHIMLLAVENEVVIGMVSAVEYFHPDKPSQLWINEIGVAPKQQNKEIGRQLIKEAIVQGKKRGCKYTWLGTDIDNFKAQRCFASIPNGNQPEKFLLYEWESTT